LSKRYTSEADVDLSSCCEGLADRGEDTAQKRYGYGTGF
jgi:hypothetical protein